MIVMQSFLALDVGSARIGVALANNIARIAAPLPFIANNDAALKAIKDLVTESNIDVVVVGWPRGLDGQSTAQTAYVEAFVAELKKVTDVMIELQDEALTSVKAENELTKRGKVYEKGDVDSLSAAYILDDYLLEHGN